MLKDGKLAFVFGTPGGETIGQTEFQMLVNLIDFRLPVQQAIEAPRFSLDADPNFYKPGAEIEVSIEGACRKRPSTGSRQWATSCACCRVGAASATCRRFASTVTARSPPVAIHAAPATRWVIKRRRKLKLLRAGAGLDVGAGDGWFHVRSLRLATKIFPDDRP